MKNLYFNSGRTRDSIKKVFTFLLFYGLTVNIGVWGQKLQIQNQAKSGWQDASAITEKDAVNNDSKEYRDYLLEQERMAASANYYSSLMEYHSPVFWNKDNKIFSQFNTSDELLERRTRNSKHFKMADGSCQTVISNGSIHYQDEGFWKEINTELVSSVLLFSGYENTTNSIKSYFPSANPSVNGIYLSTGTARMVQGKNQSIVWFNSDNAPQVIETANNSVADVKKNKITYNNFFSTGKLEYFIEPDQVKHNIILNALPASIQELNDGYLGFSEDIELPQGWNLKFAGKIIDSETTAAGPLTVVDASGAMVYTFPVPEIYELNAPSVSLASADGYRDNISAYYVKPTGNTYQIVVRIPVNWFKARVFPVVIDPTAICYGDYGGWQGGTGSSYNEGLNSTYVYVGPGYSAWTRFNISGIPTGAAVTATNLYMYCNQVGGITPATITVNDVTGTYGPYGAYNAAAYTDLRNGAYSTFSCASGPATYGPITLGSTANTHLQNKISSGYFQLGFSGTQDTSNYKRFTSNSNYLVVSYTIALACGNTPLASISPSACNPQDASYSSGTIPYWNFTAYAGYTYHFTLGANAEDSYLHLYDASMNQIAYDDDSGPGASAFLNWTCATSGTYYISASHYSCSNLYNSSYMTYWITINANYSSVSGSTITPVTSWQNQAYAAGYLYYYYFSAVEGYSYDFSLCDNSEDSYLKIYDEFWNQMAFADDNGPHCAGMAASINWACATTGTYIIAINKYSCFSFTNSGNLAYKCNNHIVDHGGDDWTINSDTIVSGVHSNIGTFIINPGVTVLVESGSHYFYVEADNVVVSGTINANGVGYTGGAGGSYGGLWAQGGYSDGRGILTCWLADSCVGLGQGGGYHGTSGSGPGGGGYGSNGAMGYGSKQECFGFFIVDLDEGGMVGGGGGAGGGAGGTYGGTGGAGMAGGQGGSEDNQCGNAGCQTYIEGAGGTGGSVSSIYGNAANETIDYGSGGAGGGGGGRGSFCGTNTCYSAGGSGGAGGGAVKLVANQNLIINVSGAIYANGANGGTGGEGGENNYSADCCSDISSDCTEQTFSAPGGGGSGAGGGSGGGIMLKANCSMTMNGTLRANGGNGGQGGDGGYSDWGASYYGGKGSGGAGGGGGRIKIFRNPCGTNTIAGTITASGGTGGTVASFGRAGTGTAGNAGISGTYTTNNSSTAIALTGGTIATNQTICSGENPALLTNSLLPSLADCAPSLTYQWMLCTSGCTSVPTGYTAISGETGLTYDPPSGLTQTTYYTRRVTSGSCTAYSNFVMVSVNDTNAPLITCPGDITISCGESLLPENTGTAAATDNCSAVDSIVIIYSDTGNINTCGGTIFRTWKATDQSGNSSVCSQVITASPSVLPVMTAPADTIIDCGIMPVPGTIVYNNGLTGNCLIGGMSDTSTFSMFPDSCDGTITETWTATDVCGRALVPVSRLITFNTGYLISGKTRYCGKATAGNPAPNPPVYNTAIYNIDNVIVILKSYPAGVELARDTSDVSGNYQFSDVPDGDYLLSYDKYTTDTMQWGNDINVADVSMLKYLIASDTLQDPSRCFASKYRKAGNVDNNLSLNVIDVSRIKSKIASPYLVEKNFPKGNWVALNKAVTVSGADVNMNLETICYGDYNASSSKYRDSATTWNGLKSTTSDILVVSDDYITSVDPAYFEIPLRISTKMNDFSALGLELTYPSDTYQLVNVTIPKAVHKTGDLKINPTLEEIINADNDLLVTDEDGTIRVVYATTAHFDVSEGEELINLGFRSLHPKASGALEFKLAGTGLIADQYGIENEDAYLLMPRLFVQGGASEPGFEFTAYPNPFSSEATIIYAIPESGNVKIKVYNALGELVSELVNGNQAGGRHTALFSANNLPSGVYTFKLEYLGSDKAKCLMLKLIH